MRKFLTYLLLLYSCQLAAQYTEFIQHFGLAYSKITLKELPVTYQAISYDARFSFANLYNHSISLTPHVEIGLANNKTIQNPFQLYGAYGIGVMWSYGHGATSYAFPKLGCYTLLGLRGIAYEQKAIESIVWPKEASWSSGKYITEFGVRCYLDEVEESLGLGVGASWCSFQQQPITVYLKFTSAILP